MLCEDSVSWLLNGKTGPSDSSMLLDSSRTDDVDESSEEDDMTVLRATEQ